MRRVTRSSNSDHTAKKGKKRNRGEIVQESVVSIRQEADVEIQEADAEIQEADMEPQEVDMEPQELDIGPTPMDWSGIVKIGGEGDPIPDQGVCKFCEFTYDGKYKYRIHLLVEHIVGEDSDDESYGEGTSTSTFQFPIKKKSPTTKKDAKGKGKSKKEENHVYMRIDESDITKAEAKARQEARQLARQYTKKQKTKAK